MLAFPSSFLGILVKEITGILLLLLHLTKQHLKPYLQCESFFDFLSSKVGGSAEIAVVTDRSVIVDRERRLVQQLVEDV